MKEIKIGDKLLVEQAWEDEAGYAHDEYATVTGIAEDGKLRLRFRSGSRDLNKWLADQEYFASDFI